MMRAALVALVMLVATPGWAQSTGEIAGAVTDETGGVMPGVTVQAASPALIEGVRVAVTDGNGLYRLVDLRPGTYDVTFELVGFSTIVREGIELNAGFTAAVDVVMTLGALNETIVVTGSNPVVDVQRTRQQTVLTDEVLSAVPTAKNFQSLAKLTLGITSESPLGGGDAGGSKGESVFGFNQIHGSPSGVTTIDGMKTTSAYRVSTAHRYIFNAMTAEEIVMETSGGDAESESAGVNVNLVPKEGGNLFSGSLLTEFTNSGLQAADNLNDSLRDRFLTRTNTTDHIYDVGFGLGGPIVEDRLWFYGAYRDWGAKESLAGVFRNAIPETLFYEPDSSRPGFYNREQQDASLRFTLQATDNQKFSFSGGVQKYLWEGSFFQFNPEGHWNFEVFPNNMWVTKWVYTPSNRVLIEAGVSLRQDRQKNTLPFPDSPGSRRPVLELSTGIAYGSRYASTTTVGDTDLGDYGNQYAYQSRASLTYITGSHSLKVGYSSMTGQHEVRAVQPVFDEQFHFFEREPVALRLGAFPHAQLSRLKYMLGIYVQDTWTLDRLTMNMGLRFDALNAYNPAQTRPGGQYVDPFPFAEVRNVPNWKDFSPRLGAAYDLFGNGRTAIKVQLGRYPIYETLGLTVLTNPASQMAATTTRTWVDANSNFVPDCDLRSPGANGECGPFDNRLFGTPLPTQQFSSDVTEGWHVRPTNWTMSAVVQQELLSNVGLEVGFFRTTYGNQRVADNLAVTPGDFDQFCVAAPTDPRLPGGGGYQICDLYDVRPGLFGQVDNIDVHADDFGGHSDVYNGVDITLNARLPRGALFFGGVSVGTRTQNVCNNPDVPPQFCETTRGWTEQGQIKFGGSYPLPLNFTASATWQNLPGLPRTATLSYSNADIRQSLGRDLSACQGITPCNARRTIQILEPMTNFEPRYNVVDFRLSYSAMVNNVRIRPQIDIFNLTNSGAAAFVFGNWGAAWPFPFEVSTARLVKFGLQVDF